MEHLVQFGITIDDDKIEQMVATRASDAVVKEIKENTRKITTYNCGESELRLMFKNEVKRICEEQKDAIIEEVIKTVSQNIMKTKAMVEAKAKLVDEMATDDGK